MAAASGSKTLTKEYAERLIRRQTAGWKQWLDVQAPFRWNLRRLDPGFTLDIGCGIGRNLAHLPGRAAEGRLITMTPQEAGFRSDATHVELMDFARLARISVRLGFQVERTFSFPFPRWAGRLFTHIEFVVVSTKPARRAA